MHGHSHHEELIEGITSHLKIFLEKSSQSIYIYLDDEHKACNKIFAAMLGGLGGLGGGEPLLKGQDVGQFPLFSGDIDAASISKIIGLGFLMMTPEAGNLVKNAIGAKGPNLGGGAMAAMGAGAGVAAAGARRGFAGAQNNLPSGYNKEDGSPPTSPIRFINPAYYRQKAAVKQATVEGVARKTSGAWEEQVNTGKKGGRS